MTDQVEDLLARPTASLHQVVHPLLRLFALDVPGTCQLPHDLFGSGPRDLAQHRTGLEVLPYAFVRGHTQQYIHR